MKAGEIVFGVMGAILRVVVIIFAIFFIYKGALICYDYGYRIFTEPAYTIEGGTTQTIAYTKDMSPKDLGRMLEEKGLIGDATLFTLQYYLSEFKGDVKNGVYQLSSSMTAEEMMEVMTGVFEGENAEPEETGSTNDNLQPLKQVDDTDESDTDEVAQE